MNNRSEEDGEGIEVEELKKLRKSKQEQHLLTISNENGKGINTWNNNSSKPEEAEREKLQEHPTAANNMCSTSCSQGNDKGDRTKPTKTNMARTRTVTTSTTAASAKTHTESKTQHQRQQAQQ